ncbi:cyclin-P3-1 [Canna indica]|uniref:Cyclin-P3-1 n=1 Tax=Canna indica TaxID=4628 RepID=A0AAQ3Q2Y3_9LILI|nr:cyclin-P3-1 [Canna indica]
MRSTTPDADAINSDVYLVLGLTTSYKRVPEFPRVLSLLSSIFETTVQKNELQLDTLEIKETGSAFNGLRAPTLSIKRYIERIFKYSKCSPSCFVLAYIYIERYIQKPNMHLTSLNVHRLLITSVVAAAKFIDDAFFSNAYYAKVGGISTKEMNRLEINFLFSLDFRLQVNVDTFTTYCSLLEKEAKIFRVDRPVKTCGINKCTNIEDSKCQSAAVHRYSCGTV